jgi:hypothetical protein
MDIDTVLVLRGPTSKCLAHFVSYSKPGSFHVDETLASAQGRGPKKRAVESGCPVLLDAGSVEMEFLAEALFLIMSLAPGKVFTSAGAFSDCEILDSAQARSQRKGSQAGVCLFESS